MAAFSVALSGVITTASPVAAMPPVSVKVSVFNEGTAVPYTTLITTPVHPGAQAGIELTWFESRWFRLAPSLNAGYMFHRYLFHGPYLGAEQGFDFKSPWGVTLKSAVGAAYLHTFATTQEYQWRDGQFVSRPDTGNPRFMPSLSLGLGYRFEQERVASPEVSVSYQTWLEFPYSPGFIPLMSHTNLHVGLSYPFWP